MGEVRIKIRLTNSMDEALARRNRLDPSKIRSMEVTALVDTGAICSVVPPHVAEQLDLQIAGHRMAEYADGRKDNVGVTEAIVFDVLGRHTNEEALVLGDEVLIGQTVLEKLDLLVDCANQRLIGKLDLLVDCANQRLIANPAHPDQPVTKVK